MAACKHDVPRDAQNEGSRRRARPSPPEHGGQNFRLNEGTLKVASVLSKDGICYFKAFPMRVHKRK